MRVLLLVTAAALAPSELGPALHRVGLQEEAAALLLDAAPGCELTSDDAACKVSSHVRDAAARRDRHDAVCRRVAAACRSLHSDVRRDAPLWRLGIELSGPGRRAVDVSICRDGAWSFVAERAAQVGARAGALADSGGRCLDRLGHAEGQVARAVWRGCD